MNIRLATAKDAAGVAAILRKHYEKDYKGFVTFNGAYIKKKMKENGFYFVAEDNRKIIGCQRASIIDLDLAELRTLCVDEKHRRKGVARELINTTLDFLKKKRMRKVVARTKSDNKAIIKLLKSMGFKKEGHFREHFRKKVNIIQWYRFL